MMATSRILEMVNSIIAQLAAIPWDWGKQKVAVKGKLCQNVAMWNKQTKYAEDGKGFPFATPAAYVELLPQDYTQLGSGWSMADISVRIHLCDRQLDAADGTIDQNLEVYTYRDLIKANLVLFRPANCSNLFEIHEHQDYDHDSIFHYVLDFQCAFTDSKGSNYDPDQQKVISIEPVPIEIDAMYNDGPPVVVEVFMWQDCLIDMEIVATPDPTVTQQLANGAVIPLQYALNGDGTLTVPILATNASISVLYFLLNNGTYPVNLVYNKPANKFDLSIGGFGVFGIGDTIEINASLPNYVP